MLKGSFMPGVRGMHTRRCEGAARGCPTSGGVPSTHGGVHGETTRYAAVFVLEVDKPHH